MAARWPPRSYMQLRSSWQPGAMGLSNTGQYVCIYIYVYVFYIMLLHISISYIYVYAIIVVVVSREELQSETIVFKICGLVA